MKLILLLISVSSFSIAFSQKMPEFSWDKVPVYIHFGKNAGMTEAEIAFVATHSSLVSLEKGHGSNRHGSTELGIEADAVALKLVNPHIKVMYYWNGFLDYNSYEAHKVYAQHPEWWLHNADGTLDEKNPGLMRYDLSNEEVQNWWSDEAQRAVINGSCDGVFLDAVPQITTTRNIAQWGQTKYDAILAGLDSVMVKTRRKIGNENIILYNGIRNTPTLHTGMDQLHLADAVCVEHFTHFASAEKEQIAQDIENIISAGKQGKIVTVKGWPSFDFTQSYIRTRTYEQLLQQARDEITFSLACYLIAAQEYSYFCYSWGYREGHGSLDWYDEFDRSLGAPEGDYVKEGWLYTRHFEFCDVSVNLETKEAKVDFYQE